jgi:hypothetical protein
MSTQISTKTIVQDEGTTVLSNDIINFTGSGVTVSNVGGAATVDIPGNIPSTSYGLYAQTVTGPNVTGIAEQSIIGAGVGTLSVPANAFSIGDSFTAALDGIISCISSATIHIYVKTVAGAILADTGVVSLAAATNKSWILNLYFTVRTLGGVGVASISSGGLFSYIRNGGTQFEGFVLSTINATTFDTTVNNELVITAQFNTANAGNTIKSYNFTLQKVY